MPIISRVGNRSWKVRAIYGSILAILAFGAVTMIYPLMLMLSGSVKSETDFIWITPFPEYLTDDNVLWMKYVESKYFGILYAEPTYQRPIGSWRTIEPPKVNEELVKAFREFRQDVEWPDYWFAMGHQAYEKIYAKNAREFRRAAREKFNDNIDDVSRAFGVRYSTWSQVGPPFSYFVERRFNFPQDASYSLLYEVKRQVPARDWIVMNPDGDFWHKNLRTQWSTVELYNAAHDTNYDDYRDVVLSTTPPTESAQRADWELYVREQLNPAFIRLSKAALPAWQNFLKTRYVGQIKNLNLAWGDGAHYEDFTQIPLSDPVPKFPREQSDLSAFLKDTAALPLEMISVYGPRQAFEEYLAQKNSPLLLASVEAGAPVSLPLEQVDYADFRENTGALRWEFVKRNYIAVGDFLLMHGNGIRNTIIYCSLMIAATLVVNPLAAYALSRYRPPSTYTILLFCMCTMAFPAEVTMIPSFLLLKQFPLFSLIVGIGVAVVACALIYRLRPAMPQWLIGVLGAAVGVIAGWWLTPIVSNAILGRSDPSVSLLNTFWALILPSMANGFSIFLLKGFFDSLPKELFEAADIDGATEWHKFWIITMSLSKPILAVLALGAFTTAYSEFMMALVIIPDRDMWTIMVWLFQLQQRVHPSVVYASLVVAAIPTFLVFVFCQNLIMRGIVVPVEK